MPYDESECGPACALLAESGIVAIDINEGHRLIGHCGEARVQAFAKQHDWKLTGDLRPCEACIQAKARAKAVSRTTMTRATTKGERLFMDISDPYASAGRNKFWVAVVDDNTLQVESFYPQQERYRGGS
jgi:hypothetical protein